MLIHAPSRSVILRAPDPLMLRDLAPSESRMLDHPDYNIALKHTLDMTRMLNNIGFKIPSPIESQYHWPGKYKPFPHQIEMAAFMTLHQRCFNLSEMGVGKTAATLWAADYLMKAGVIRRAMILTPLSTMELTWMQDIFDVLMHRTAIVVHGGAEERRKALAYDLDFYIINHDGIVRPDVREGIAKRGDIDLMILDEASMFRNWDTDKYKFLLKTLTPKMRLWALTGTPVPNEPTDAWALAKLVDPSRVPKFFGAFRRMTMTQISQFQWRPKPDSAEIAYAALQPAIRFEKRKVLTLPSLAPPRKHLVLLTAEQQAAYDEMRHEMEMSAKLGPITAVNAADKIGKLRQICLGAIKHPETGEYIVLDHQPRLQKVLDLIRMAKAKVIIVVPFRGIVTTLARELGQHVSVGVLNGGVSPGARNRIIKAFKTGPDPHALLCHPKVMSHGLNLTEADMTIFYGPIYSNDENEQVVARFDRTGQKHEMTTERIGSGPMEWAIYRMVDTRMFTQNSVLKLYDNILGA